jgi:hypothetical protein
MTLGSVLPPLRSLAELQVALVVVVNIVEAGLSEVTYASSWQHYFIISSTVITIFSTPENTLYLHNEMKITDLFIFGQV